MNDFYALSYASVNTHKATSTETKDCKERQKEGVTINSLKQFITEIKSQNQLKKKRSRPKNPDEIQKLSFVKLNKNNFDSLIQDVYNNLNNDEFKINVDKKTYDLKNVKGFLVKIKHMNCILI